MQTRDCPEVDNHGTADGGEGNPQIMGGNPASISMHVPVAGAAGAIAAFNCAVISGSLRDGCFHGLLFEENGKRGREFLCP